MTPAVAIVNLVLGAAYCGYGVMTAIEMRRDRRIFGFSHFGLAWIFTAFTCGPHHLAHGVHLAFEGRAGQPLDLVSVVVGLPVGLVWLSLRVEAFVGGRGDRFIPGTPPWLRAAPTLAAVFVTTLAAAALQVGAGRRLGSVVAANGLLLVVYGAIGWCLLRTQLRNRAAMGGWSVFGLSLTAVMGTCALMHAVWALYASTGAYHGDVHAVVIDWLSVPAGLYCLSVVRSLYRDSRRDWNRATTPAAVVEA